MIDGHVDSNQTGHPVSVEKYNYCKYSLQLRNQLFMEKIRNECTQHDRSF